MIRILTKNAVDNTNIDGARDHNFNAGRKSGIVKGVLNEGKFFTITSNIICLDTCELRLFGHRIVVEEPITHTIASTPLTATRYSFIAQVIVDDNFNVSFSTFIQLSSTELIQDNLDKTGKGTYQLEIGKFTQLSDGTLTDVTRTADLITGGAGGGDSEYIRIGTVTTNKISPELDADVDIENTINPDDNKPQTNFKFNLPTPSGTVINIGGEEQSSINFNSDPQTQITDNFSNSVHTTEQTLTNEQKTQARTNIGALSSADLTMWSQRLYEERDLNALANIGDGKAYISVISPITENTPKSNIYGNVISFRSGSGELTQIVMETHSGKMYYRASATSEGFGTWKEVVLTQSINLANTGYVAFSNGLKIQWGRANMPSQIEVGGLITPTVPLPISMTSENYKILGSSSRSDVNIGYGDSHANSFVLGLRNLGSSAITTSSTYSWVIIGW